jgi:replicative DNA helicase
MQGGLDFEGSSGAVSIAEALGRTLDHMERKGAHSRADTWISSGYPDLDAATDGLPSGTLTQITGAPGAGKTALALAISRHIAAREGQEVLYVTGTDPIEALMIRLLSYESDVPVRDISRGRLRGSSWTDFGSAVKLLSELPLNFLEDPHGSIDGISATVAMIERERSLGAVFIDPLSSVKGWSENPVAMGSVLSRLGRIAAQHAVPVVVVTESAGGARSEEAGDTELELFVSRDTEPAVPGAGASTVCITVYRAGCTSATVRMAWDGAHVRISQPVLPVAADLLRSSGGEGRRGDAD